MERIIIVAQLPPPQNIQGVILGRGGFGRVYKGRNNITMQIVAIKLIEKQLQMNSKLNELIANEIEALSNVKHKNIIKLETYAKCTV